MPRRIPLTREEKLARREALAARAAAGDLHLPDAIRQMRDALDMTQAAFGEKFGLTRIQVLNLEKGSANPTRETLERIGRPFGFVLGFVPRPRQDEDGPS